ncbi:MAG: hypothetical protein KME59_21345 [Trichormus sp. ATA11-4-KO1]|jgi:hypothetical protein|nr:hypothetical protein [Trichormus sp. ATA11-4-KO1]
MSRTQRDIQYSNDAGIRIVRFRNNQRLEQQAIDELYDYGLLPNPRLMVRANRLTHPNDDLTISAVLETYIREDDE